MLQVALTVFSVAVGKVVPHLRLRNGSIVSQAFKNDPLQATIVYSPVLSTRQIFGASYLLVLFFQMARGCGHGCFASGRGRGG
jgi:hypothetical protein